MKRITTIAAALVATASLGLAACGSGDDTTTTTASAKPVTVTAPWARVTAAGAKTGAAYMTIASTGGDVLTKVSVPASVAGMAQLHETTTSGGSMDGSAMKGMKEVSSLEIPAGGSVQLKPGGYHIMLMELAKPITAGATIPVTLTFEKAGAVTVDAVARQS